MGNNKEIQNVSKATIGRLPAYHRYLKEKLAEGEKTISSTSIAEDLHLNAVQVRKDLSVISTVAGKPKLGFEIAELIEDINRILGYDNVTDAVLVGAGGLGSALAGYDGFKNYGLNIVAVFDSDPEIIDSTVNGIKVFDAAQIQHLVRRLNVLIGIITVPKSAAQKVADELIEGGVRAIWNFAPVHLNVPENIAVKNEDMAASLAILSKRLAEILNNEK
ncbi:MAG TPA: redox-sensing transcriptional repressor Rex [Candidatus Borkfalkia excrementigallinarum]|uniref:Redox-sensing transcriptional repressor Rex n=1 Tax=Candidatus Borkfalkia excrementigallinarum TaxID=2838506 RepID=A0A9D2CQL8_9FIRM|nr:redox-sensing transcriptional repressor Rex [Candidatus Borkfalkia excrementigallinarum]